MTPITTAADAADDADAVCIVMLLLLLLAGEAFRRSRSSTPTIAIVFRSPRVSATASCVLLPLAALSLDMIPRTATILISIALSASSAAVLICGRV
jgi:hypothetical protein